MLVGQNEIWSRELGFWRFAFHQIQTNRVSSKEFQAKTSFYMVGPLSSIFAPRIRVMKGQIGVKMYLVLWMVLTYNLLQNRCIDDDKSDLFAMICITQQNNKEYTCLICNGFPQTFSCERLFRCLKCSYWDIILKDQP